MKLEKAQPDAPLAIDLKMMGELFELNTQSLVPLGLDYALMDYPLQLAAGMKTRGALSQAFNKLGLLEVQEGDTLSSYIPMKDSIDFTGTLREFSSDKFTSKLVSRALGRNARSAPRSNAQPEQQEQSPKVEDVANEVLKGLFGL